MIYDIFENITRYCDKDESLYKAVKYIQNFKEDTADGIYQIEDDKIYSIVKTYHTFPLSEKLFETHEKYIDVQALLYGEEAIHISLNNHMDIAEPYNANTDKVRFKPSKNYSTMLLLPGYFLLLYPGDIHRADCQWHEKTLVRKIAVKVHVETLRS